MSKKDNSAHITSHQQSGGITAQNVNTGNGNTQFSINNKRTKEEKSSSLKKTVLIITGIATFLAAIATILNYFDILPFTK